MALHLPSSNVSDPSCSSHTALTGNASEQLRTLFINQRTTGVLGLLYRRSNQPYTPLQRTARSSSKKKAPPRCLQCSGYLLLLPDHCRQNRLSKQSRSLRRKAEAVGKPGGAVWELELSSWCLRPPQVDKCQLKKPHHRRFLLSQSPSPLQWPQGRQCPPNTPTANISGSPSSALNTVAYAYDEEPHWVHPSFWRPPYRE